MSNNQRREGDEANVTLNLIGFALFLIASTVINILANGLTSYSYFSNVIWQTAAFCLPTVWVFILEVPRKFKEAYLWSVAGLVLGVWFSWALDMAGVRFFWRWG